MRNYRAISQEHRAFLQRIGKEYENKRKLAGYSRREMAKMIGVNENVVTSFEMGNNNNLIVFLKYCILFGMAESLFS